MSHVKSNCEHRLGPGVKRQKSGQECALSYGAGRALLMPHVLGSSVPIELLSTTTQRAGQGLSSRASYVFEAVCELVTALADERLNEIVTPILGAGHGGMDPSTAFVILVLALAERSDTFQAGPSGARPLSIFRRATIVRPKSTRLLYVAHWLWQQHRGIQPLQTDERFRLARRSVQLRKVCCGPTACYRQCICGATSRA